MGMTQNKYLLGMLFLVTTILAISIVSAADEEILQIGTNMLHSNAKVGGHELLNVNLTVVNATINFTCAVYAKSATTANSSWVTLYPMALNSTNGTIWSADVNVSGLEDSKDYQFNFTCRVQNITESHFGSNLTTATVLVDNFAPTAPTLDPGSNTQITAAATTTFTGTVVDGETTNCTYKIARGGTTSGSDYTAGTGTYSGTSCTFTKIFSTSADNGNWYWSITADDGTNETQSVTNIYQVLMPGPGSGSNLGGVTQPSIGISGGLQNIINNLGNLSNIYKLILVVAIFLIIYAISQRR